MNSFSSRNLIFSPFHFQGSSIHHPRLWQLRRRQIFKSSINVNVLTGICS
jgi:hypothetical protein